MRLKIILVLMLPFVVACSNEKQEKIDALKSECIDIHDDVMPRLGEVVNLSTEIKDVLKTMEPDTNDSIRIVRADLVSHMLLLDSAHEAMMNWMAEFEPSFEETHSADSAIVHYELEVKLIEQVRDLMLKSIEDGKKVLESRD